MSTPVRDPLATLGRAAVRQYAADLGARRVGALRAYAGVPGPTRIALDRAAPADRALREDLLGRVLEGWETSTPPLVWVTRTGDVAPGEQDLAWYAAARSAFGRHGRALPAFLVVNRRAWRDLVSDRSHAWQRVRPAPAARE